MSFEKSRGVTPASKPILPIGLCPFIMATQSSYSLAYIDRYCFNMNETILNGVSKHNQVDVCVSKHNQVDVCVYIFLKIQIEFDLFTCRVFIYSLENFLLF